MHGWRRPLILAHYSRPKMVKLSNDFCNLTTRKFNFLGSITTSFQRTPWIFASNWSTDARRFYITGNRGRGKIMLLSFDGFFLFSSLKWKLSETEIDIHRRAVKIRKTCHVRKNFTLIYLCIYILLSLYRNCLVFQYTFF